MAKKKSKGRRTPPPAADSVPETQPDAEAPQVPNPLQPSQNAPQAPPHPSGVVHPSGAVSEGSAGQSPVGPASGAEAYEEPFHPSKASGGNVDPSALLVDGIPQGKAAVTGNETPKAAPQVMTADQVQEFVANSVAKMFAQQNAPMEKAESPSAPAETNEKQPYYASQDEFQKAVQDEVKRRLDELQKVGPKALTGLDVTPVKDSRGNTIWMYVNRNPFPVWLPDPNDPGSRVEFPPCPDESVPLGMMDFRTHPFFANFVGFKRSVKQEAVPAYLHITEADVETDGVAVYDLMSMPPEAIAQYLSMLQQTNPDIAAQITRGLGTKPRLPQAANAMVPRGPSQAPPGV